MDPEMDPYQVLPLAQDQYPRKTHGWQHGEFSDLGVVSTHFPWPQIPSAVGYQAKGLKWPLPLGLYRVTDRS